MTEEKTIGYIAFIILIVFIAFLFPQLANNAFASTSTSYAKPVLVAMVYVFLGATIIFLVAKVVDNIG